jgi:ATP-dependent helicase/nuclease subunit A
MGATGELVNPPIHDAIRTARDAEDQAEGGRILYVAMTRARDWLLLSGCPGSRSAGDSWLQVFNELYDLSNRRDREEFSGCGWRAILRRKGVPCQRPLVQPGKIELPPRHVLEIRIGPAPVAVAGRKTFAVTDVVQAMLASPVQVSAGEPSLSCERGISINPIQWGTLVHRLFQKWDLRAPLEEVIEGICAQDWPAIQGRRETIEGLRAVAARFAASPLGKRMAREEKVLREVPFLLRTGNVLLSGVIDAVLDDGTVVDYKTGSITPGTNARYEAQLLLYAAAVSRLLGKRLGRAYLYYADVGRQLEVETAAEGVDAVVRQAREAVETLRA